ncbi:DinB family protein [Ureibacillus aquaedulcis]|uniref:DinB family protein n=1 Tax=Ureibacillus aquaedulcis TaxID=3058421 RepID=A0ABT8GQQ0_9BACL|nr:DinB family protein [Ureibacillus sp. BA0131]MDN4493574.1 DinB family protein [Ureibacillus sp. BA0131]
MIFQQINLVRQNTLNEMTNLTEEQADLVPAGFSNSIRWNLGHIYTVQNGLISQFGGKVIETPAHYFKLFAPGTKPADWPAEVPTLHELKQLLEEQPARLQKALAGQLEEQAEKAFKTLSTVGEILNFTTYHEGMHLGAIKGLKKANRVAE